MTYYHQYRLSHLEEHIKQKKNQQNSCGESKKLYFCSVILEEFAERMTTFMAKQGRSEPQPIINHHFRVVVLFFESPK